MRFLPETNRRESSTMKSPRIPLSWIFISIVAIMFAFFGYQIYQASVGNTETETHTNTVTSSIQYATPVMAVNQLPSAVQQEPHAPIHKKIEEVHALPEVVGQTQEDLRAEEPLQQTPRDVQYYEPAHTDPLEPIVHSSAEFGETLRHPEQMIEVHPPLGTARVSASGLGSDNSSQGGHNSVGYSPEMAQNGGEFMHGISAFDGSDGVGIGFSMI